MYDKVHFILIKCDNQNDFRFYYFLVIKNLNSPEFFDDQQPNIHSHNFLNIGPIFKI